jgi:RNA polymerase sigma factor (sigma-70 family)
MAEDQRCRLLADSELLRRFGTRLEEAAFHSLLRRHGSMVLHVCRNVLANEQDAEDAFQATFLVLAQKAGAIRKEASIGSWLYGVAYRTALKARAACARRQKHECRAAGQAPSPAADELSWREVQKVVCAELNRLSEPYRLPLVLCYLEGKTQDEAARLMSVSKATLKKRLDRGRELLRVRLLRRGLGPAAALVASAWPMATSAANLPQELVSLTLRAATDPPATAQAAGLVSARVAALTEGVLQSMFLTKLRTIAAIAFFVAGMIVCGAGALIHETSGGQLNGEPQSKPAGPPQDRSRESGPILGHARGIAGKPTWREILVLNHEHPVTVIASGSEWSAAGDEGGNLFFWKTTTGTERKPLLKGGKNKASVDRLQFIADGKQLFCVLDGGKFLFRLDLENQKGPGLGGRIPIFLGVSADGETWLERHNAGRTLALRPNPWTRNAAEFESIRYDSAITHAAVSADDKLLAVVTKDGTLHLHDRASLRKLRAIATKEGVVVKDMQFSPAGDRIALARDDALAQVFDTATGEEVASLKGHRGIVFAIAFKPDGKKLVTGGDDTTARLWDATTGKTLAVLEGHADSVRCVTFDPSGETLLTGSADRTVKLWRIK